MGKNKKEEISYNTGPIKASTKLHEIIKKKITTAVEFASKKSIYNPHVTATELNTAQSILLSLMHSLLTNDLGFCISLLELATTVDHLRSSYLPTWLRDDFNFEDQQVLRVLSKIALLVQSGLIIIPTHILKVFVSLSSKYRIIECCRASEDKETLKFLLEFNLQEHSGNNQSTTMASSFSSEVPQLLPNHSVQKFFKEAAVKRKSFVEGPTKPPSLHNMNAQNVLTNFMDDEVSFVERTENPSPTLQEVWVETTAPTQLPASAITSNSISSTTSNQASSSELYMYTVREYLKVPEDFNEEELLSLVCYSDTEGITPLHRAVRDGNPYVVECLLMLGAKINEKDSFGSTPSHCAASIGSVPILQVLAQNQADLSLTRNDGCSPLHEAIINGHEGACRWLLEHGSDINGRNIDGWAPLHMAAQWDKQEIVKILLENGADSKIYNNHGKTPADVAREEGHTSILELLSV
ncbi:unnamed protein product [Nezara viridula]|uniref:Ankyrin repeat protein n=1 Tax=Nezara viridula TaxID=85310 RepID=A0A9P0MRY0_NEZVI|nr:unnamed protein product [Nezara viridula]